MHKITDVKLLYNSKAAAFYRKRNQATSANQPFSEEEPNYEEGRTLLDGRRISENGQAYAKEVESAPKEVKRQENVHSVEEGKNDQQQPQDAWEDEREEELDKDDFEDDPLKNSLVKASQLMSSLFSVTKQKYEETIKSE